MIQLSDHFTYKKLLSFTIPSIVMVIFTSLYTIVDGIFVSNVAGNDAFAALNLIWPIIAIMGAVGFMIGMGGSALIAKTLGEGEHTKANEIFSMLIYVLMGIGALLSVIGIFFMEDFARLLGASEKLVPYCVIYGRTLSIFMVGYFLQNASQSFLVTAERPKLSLALTLAAGFTNIVLDYLFISVFRWGILGAALATGLSWLVGGIIPFFYFLFPNPTPLALGKTRLDLRALGQACFNGSSEMISNLSMSVINVLYNLELMKMIGSDGVVAYGIIQYIAFVFVGAYLGYAFGITPVLGYQYGANNHKELKNLLKKSLILIAIAAFVLTILAEMMANLLASIFVSYSIELMTLTSHAIRIYSLSFLVAGFNIFASSFFTALNNGLISGLLSFVRTFVFQVVSIIVMPLLFGLDGIWAAILVAEVGALFVSAFFLNKEKKKYGY